MLTNQTFLPLPWVVLGPEVFAPDAHDALPINFGVVVLFRQHLLTPRSFSFLFLGLETDSNERMLSDLEKLGFNFSAKFLCNSKLPRHLHEARMMISGADLIFSPAVSRLINISNLKTPTNDRLVFIEGLLHFSKHAEFTQNNFAKFVEEHGGH